MHKRLFLKKTELEIVAAYSDFCKKFDSAGWLKKKYLTMRHPIFFDYHRKNLDIRTSTDKLVGEHKLKMADLNADEYKRHAEVAKSDAGQLKAELNDLAAKEEELKTGLKVSQKVIASKNKQLAALSAELRELKDRNEKGKTHAGELS